MGICIIGEVDIKKFLEKRINKQKGVVLDTKGNIIGEHDGVWFYTIGQRHGFSITKYFGEPLYVVAKNAQRNELIVGFEKGAYCDAFSAEDVHWISGKLPTTDFNCDIRIRHLGELYKAHVLVESAGSYGNEKLQIKVEEPIFAVAAGQSVVLYQNDVVLGGGIIA
jgi:tRNA-specific 2-thiouridylase